MPEEIERKFLVKGDSWRNLAQPELFRQGYLAGSENCLVRLRTEGSRGVLTIKGKRKGITGSEFEYEIPLADCEAMLRSLALPGIIEKLRYHISFQGAEWVIDEFLGENKGLIVAEIELTSEMQSFAKPDWADEEVSFDARYTNYSLSQMPYSRWPRH